MKYIMCLYLFLHSPQAENDENQQTGYESRNMEDGIKLLLKVIRKKAGKKEQTCKYNVTIRKLYKNVDIPLVCAYIVNYGILSQI